LGKSAKPSDPPPLLTYKINTLESHTKPNKNWKHRRNQGGRFPLSFQIPSFFFWVKIFLPTLVRVTDFTEVVNGFQNEKEDQNVLGLCGSDDGCKVGGGVDLGCFN
jgi:hypothetical protein